METKNDMKRLIIAILLFIGIQNISFAQEINVKLGPNEIALNQYWTITVDVQNDRLREYDGFPEIPGFEKSGISSSSSMNIINGQVTSTQSVIQNYVPTREGVFTVSPFTLVINGNEVRSQGKTVRVGPAREQQRQQYDPFNYDPFEDFFGNKRNTEYLEVADDAFLALSIDKDEVYVGEGFTATLAFYVSDQNRARLSFYETGKQVAEIIKQIRPKNCWEENFNIDKIDGERVTINNKMHTRYKIFQATFYPLNDEPVEFPSVDLKMIKYKEAKNPSFFSSNRQEDFKTYASKAKTVKVNPLPPHPLREGVAVGKYSLKEDISGKELKTGESFNYDFTILGEGNISAIRNPSIKNSNNFDFYSPNTQQRIRRSNERVRGSKSFSYYAIPNEPGEFNLGDYVNWIYFDPDLKVYDTLKSEISVNVTGESKRNEFISSTDLGSFYDLIDIEDNTIQNGDRDFLLKLVTNIILAVILVLTLIIIFKKNNS